MTKELDEALRKVYRELGIWQEGQKCDHGLLGVSSHIVPDGRYGIGVYSCTACHCRTGLDRCEHLEPMPPIHDGLLAVILRRLVADLTLGATQTCERWLYDVLFDHKEPVEAAALAFAAYLRAKEERPA